MASRFIDELLENFRKEFFFDEVDDANDFEFNQDFENDEDYRVQVDMLSKKD